MHAIPGKRETVRLFRARLTEAMQRADFSRAELARRAGVDRSTLSQLLSPENVRLPRADTVAGIAAALQVSLDWLLGLSGEYRPGATVLEEVLPITPQSDGNRELIAWHEEAESAKIRHVPSNLPDMAKLESVIEFEYRQYHAKSAGSAIDASHERLAYTRLHDTDMEICLSQQALQGFARAEGIWDGLPVGVRAEQLTRMIELFDEQYPALRLHIFDMRERYSVPFTVFGPKRAAIYVGQMYFAFQTAPHVQALTRHFDQLVRAATVQAHEIPAYLIDLRKRLRR